MNALNELLFSAAPSYGNAAASMRPGALLPVTAAVSVFPPARLGSVPYLNARPLTHHLPEAPLYLEPIRLAQELAQGRLEAALVPLVEVLENPGAYFVVDGVAIGSLRGVYSVVLAHTGPIVRLRTVALDPASKTSNRLLQVLLEKYLRLKPVYVAPEQEPDGRLLIGDPAIAFRQAHPDLRFYDLAEGWHAQTGLPFVFAVWAIRRETPQAAALAASLRAAARSGLADRDRLARSPFELRYLYEHLYYRLDGPQKRAIRTFGQALVELGCLPQQPELSYL